MVIFSMNKNSTSKLLFDARDQEKETFDFSYTKKLSVLEEEKNQIEQKIIAEQNKIDHIREIVEKLNKKSIDGIYSTRIEGSEKNKKTYEDILKKINENIQQYLSVKDQNLKDSFDAYIQRKKESLKNIMNLEEDRKLQTLSSIDDSIRESEEKIRELFGDDQELINEIHKDKALLVAEKEYKMWDQPNHIIQSYQKLIKAWEDDKQDSKQEENISEAEVVESDKNIWNIYHNIVQDYKLFAYLRNPEILEKFLKEVTQAKIEKNTVPLSEFFVEKKYAARDPKHIKKKEMSRVDSLVKSFLNMAWSNRWYIGLLANKWSKVDPSKMESFLRWEMQPSQIDPNNINIQTQEAAFDVIAKNMSVDIQLLRAADDYMKSLNLLPNKINIDLFLPYVQEIQRIAEQLEKAESVYDRSELYDMYVDTFENHTLFFCEYTKNITKKIPEKYKYIIIPVLTEILITTCSIAIGRYMWWKFDWGPKSANIDAFMTLRSEALCEDSVSQTITKDSQQDRSKVNQTIKMLHRMNSLLNSEKIQFREGLKDVKDKEEEERIKKLIDIQERDIHMNEVFLRYYNYFTGASNIHNMYNMLFEKDNSSNNFSEVQWSKVADLYFQNIDWTDVPYDDPMALMSDEFLLQKTKNDYAFETNRSPNEKYHGIIKIADFDAFAQDEISLNIVRKTLEITHRESKLQEITSRIAYQGENLLIKNFSNYAMMFIHSDWSFSINGHSNDSVKVLIGESEYHILRAYIFKYLLESNNTIDKRDIIWPEQLLPKVPTDADDDFHRTDPRVVYGHNEEKNSWLTKALEYRDDHKRLLMANMFPGAKWFSNAKQYKQPLYAHIYKANANPEIDKPENKIRIDEFDTYEDMFMFCKEIREEHMTEKTIVRFETYVKEFVKDDEVERVGKMHYIGKWIGKEIQQTLTSEKVA